MLTLKSNESQNLDFLERNNTLILKLGLFCLRKACLYTGMKIQSNKKRRKSKSQIIAMMRYDPSNSECFQSPRSLSMAQVTLRKFQNILTGETKHISETYE